MPDLHIEEEVLVGPAARIGDRPQLWAASPARTLVLPTTNPRVLATMAELVFSGPLP
jgi:hypothetical protein